MYSIRIRPRIREFTTLNVATVLQNINRIIASNTYPFQAKVVQHHLVVKCKEEAQAFWSPEMTLEVVENPLKGDAYAAHNEPTLVRGYISPKPSIWTFFIFAYVGLGLACLSFVVFGTSQMMLDQPTQMLWYALACLVGMVLVFIASQIGQKLGEKQTEVLLQFVKEVLKE